MELTADLLRKAEFSVVKRGYDMNEVDDFLDRAAAGIDILFERLREQFERAETADAVNREAQATIEQLREENARHRAATGGTESAEQAMSVLVQAQKTADETLTEARRQAESLVSDAEARAKSAQADAEARAEAMKASAEAEARAAADETRQRINAEVAALREDRDSLADDLRALQRWLDDQRARLRTTSRDLKRIVEDPTALKELPLPELHDDGPADEATDDGDSTAAPAATTAVDEAEATETAGDEPGDGPEQTTDGADAPEPDAAGEPGPVAAGPAGDDPDATQAVPTVEDGAGRPFDHGIPPEDDDLEPGADDATGDPADPDAGGSRLRRWRS